MLAIAARKAPSIGAISGEWNACETVRRRLFVPSLSRCADGGHGVELSGDDDILRTVDSRDRHAVAVRGDRRFNAIAAANTATIAPPAGSACIRRPRAAIRRTASSSVRMSATHAAAISPTLWPITAAGLTPQDRHISASPYSSANSAGCV